MLTPLLDACWWEINLGLSFKMEFGKGQFFLFEYMDLGGFPVMAETTRNHIFFKRNQSSDNRSHGFGAKFLLKKLSASDFSYEKKSAFKKVRVKLMMGGSAYQY